LLFLIKSIEVDENPGSLLIASCSVLLCECNGDNHYTQTTTQQGAIPTNYSNKQTPTINNQCVQRAISRLRRFSLTSKDFIKDNNAFHTRLNKMTEQEFSKRAYA
jgi:hypothetical protein